MSDPLHDALVAIFQAIAEREGKPVECVVEEFFSGYLEGASGEVAE
jgi:hypothetical protein